MDALSFALTLSRTPAGFLGPLSFGLVRRPSRVLAAHEVEQLQEALRDRKIAHEVRLGDARPLGPETPIAQHVVVRPSLVRARRAHATERVRGEALLSSQRILGGVGKAGVHASLPLSARRVAKDGINDLLHLQGHRSLGDRLLKFLRLAILALLGADAHRALLRRGE